MVERDGMEELEWRLVIPLKRLFFRENLVIGEGGGFWVEIGRFHDQVP